MEQSIYQCRDCGKTIEVINEELLGGKILVYQDGQERIEVIKCDQCYQANPSLTNYQKTEVYSRIVGYLRPVSQWNKGKREEYDQRKELKIPKDILSPEK
jgi:anaerobic ribonucleoside-triphosphate reductase